MKKILFLLLLPIWAFGQNTNGTLQRQIASPNAITGLFGSVRDTLAKASSVPPGLQDSLTKKANKTFDNVANGAIANLKLANSTISGVALGSNLAGVSPGYGLAGSTYNGSVTRTFTLDTATLSSVYIKNQTTYRQTGAFNVQSDSYIGGIRFGLGGGLDTNNTAIGRGVMRDNLTGKYLTALGYYALRKNTADYNTALGYFALLANTTGTANTAIGAQALWQNTTGGYNLAIGVEALAANTTGINNTAIGGYDPMLSNTIGSANTAVGYAALKDNVDGSDNSVVGSNALSANVSGIRNAAFGSLAGEDNTGSGNTYMGVLAGKDVASGANNTYLGYQSGLGQTAGSFNIAIGENTVLPSLTGSSQLNIGNTLYGNLSSGNMGIGISPSAVASYKVLDMDGTTGSYISFRSLGTKYGAIFGNNGSLGLETFGASSIINFYTDQGEKVRISPNGDLRVFSLAGSGDRFVVTNSSGTLSTATIGSGLSYSGGVLSATGGSVGTVTGTGTAAYIGKWTSASNMANSIMSESGSAISVAGSMTASSFSGAGTGLTGTASGLNIGGSATQWNGATRSGSTATTMTHFMSYSGSTFELAPASVAQTFLGLGSNAYTSTAYAPLASPTFTGTVSGITAAMVGAPSGSGTSSGTNTGDQTSVSGNAGTATKLATPRTIAGVSFDGSANISLNNNAITNGAGYITSSAITGKEDVSNKSTSTSLGTSNTLYPSQNAVKTYVDNAFDLAVDATKQLNVQYSTVSNNGFDETQLYQYTVPSSYVSADGDRIDFEFAGQYGATANNKDFELNIGGSSFNLVNTNLNDKSFRISGYLIRTSSSAYKIVWQQSYDNISSNIYTTGNASFGGGIGIELVSLQTSGNPGTEVSLGIASVTSTKAP